MRRYGRVALGGTFDRLHAGHEALLATAFRLGRSVAVGLTTPAFLREHPKPERRAIAPEPTRRRALTRWLADRYPRRRWTVVPLRDRFGGSVEAGVDALVVSADTVAGGRAVNRERRRRGLRPLPLIVVPLVLADDLRPVSSRRIRSGEIGRSGARIAPITVALAVADRALRAPAARGVRRAFPRARVVTLRSPVPEGSSPATLRRRAAEAVRRGEIGLAVAPGHSGGWDVAVCGPAGDLEPRHLPGRGPQDLERNLAALLGPARARSRRP